MKFEEYADIESRKQLQRAIRERHEFRNDGLCFSYFCEEVFFKVTDQDGHDDRVGEACIDIFSDLFNEQFGTDFIYIY